MSIYIYIYSYARNHILRSRCGFMYVVSQEFTRKETWCRLQLQAGMCMYVCMYENMHVRYVYVCTYAYTYTSVRVGIYVCVFM